MHDSLSPYEPYGSVTWLAKFDLVSVGLWHIWSQRFCARHDFKARVKIHIVAASLARIPTSPSGLAVPSLICASSVLTPIIVCSISERLSVRVRSGLRARKPLMLV